MLREWGNDLGFTQWPKFTYWESLTPEPPNLIGAVEPHIPQHLYNITFTSESQATVDSSRSATIFVKSPSIL